jgi:dienelactone hydrolase
MGFARRIGLAVGFVLAGVACAPLARAEFIAVPVQWQGRSIELTLDFEKPPGAGPFAVVILLAGCSAELDTGLKAWTNQLHAWGYATLRVSSTESRGLGNICGDLGMRKTMVVETSRDVFRAALAIAGRPDVKPNKIAVLGRSLGSNSLVWYVSRNLKSVNDGQVHLAARGVKIQAAVAITPNCENQGRVAVEMPLLILAGALDDWNVASRCSELASAPENAASVKIMIYPGAHHGYDRAGRPIVYFGHHVEYNAAATHDSYAQARAFLAPYLE